MSVEVASVTVRLRESVVETLLTTVTEEVSDTVGVRESLAAAVAAIDAVSETATERPSVVERCADRAAASDTEMARESDTLTLTFGEAVSAMLTDIASVVERCT